MAGNTSWAVQSVKRKRPVFTPEPRKRVKNADDGRRLRPWSSESRKQKTLTQIDWIENPRMNVEDEFDLQAIAHTEPPPAHLKPKVNKVQKRRSTLTQMNWWSGSHPHQDDTMDDLIMLPVTTAEDQGQIGQLDGTTENLPRRKRRATARNLQLAQSSSTSSVDRDTQDYLPARRVRKMQVHAQTSNPVRRRSGRIASKASQNIDDRIPHDTEMLPSVKDDQTISTIVRSPEFQAMDKCDIENENVPNQTDSGPQTPKRRREVPSSQTPETMTRRKERGWSNSAKSPLKSVVRQPLHERSANIPSKSSIQYNKRQVPALRNPPNFPKRRKICILKVPSRALLQKDTRVEDSQRDIYSLQGTSSSSLPTVGSDHQSISEQSTAILEPAAEVGEIPLSSGARSPQCNLPSSPPATRIEETRPKPISLTSSGKKRSSIRSWPEYNESSFSSQKHDRNSLIVHNSDRASQNLQCEEQGEEGPRRALQARFEEEMLLDREVENTRTPVPYLTTTAHNDIPEYNDLEVASDFGSPVANNTQFNAALLGRTSSPDLYAEEQKTDFYAIHSNIENEAMFGNIPLEQADSKDRQIHNSEAEIETPFLTPRLVQRISPLVQQEALLLASPVDEVVCLPKIDTLLHNHASGTKIPLDDTAENFSSSSPSLPATRGITPASIHPASMPHPSQLSTQEPTQNYFSSSARVPTQSYKKAEPILIKDSSSLHFSQIPLYRSQGQRLNPQLAVDTNDGIDDLDLDPSSAPRGRQSARKPTGFHRKETVSSLKSIHLSSDQASEHDDDAEAPPSSSPIMLAASSRWDQSQAVVPSRLVSAKDVPQTTIAPNVSNDAVNDSDATVSPTPSPDPKPLKRKYNPIPGFDNDTQSNFTQDGHVTAAYVHRQREGGLWPDWFVPQPFQVPNFKRPKRYEE